MHTIHYAKTHLSKLLEQVEDGKEIVLARGRKPIARLVPCSEVGKNDRPQIGETTSKALKIKEKREVAGRVGDTVVYF
jgi:prevent-host-death family protein